MFDIEFKRIKPIKIIRKLSDTDNAVVFLIKAILDGEEIECLLKILKLFHHNNEVKVLTNGYDFTAGLIEYDRPQRYLVYEVAAGEGYLYTSNDEKEEVIRSSAAVLLRIHHTDFSEPSRRGKSEDLRRIKTTRLYQNNTQIAEYINDYTENKRDYCFIHGDYHLMNLMFDEDGSVITVIDWEYCGLYYKEYDLAYAVVPRMDLYDNIDDVKLFLNSYGESFDKERFLYFYYIIMCYTFEKRDRCSDEAFLKVMSDVTELMRSGE